MNDGLEMTLIPERSAASPDADEPIDPPSWADCPDAAAIRQALDRVLSSPLFARSERLRSFLAYVVEKDMAGEAHKLKGYTIGIDVFQRPENFNADNDPLVRVHAGKLRKLLNAYYETEGCEAIWRIDIPKGTYAPAYRRSDIRRAAGTASLGHPQPDETPAAQPARLVAWDKPARTRAKPAFRRHWLPAPLASPLAMVSLVPLLFCLPLTSPALGVNPQAQARLATPIRQIGAELPHIMIRAHGTRQDPAWRLAESIRDVAGVYPVIVQTGDPLAGVPPRSASQDTLAFTLATFPALDLQATRILLSYDGTDAILSETLIGNDRVSTETGILFEALGIVSDLLGASGKIFRYAEDTRIASPLMQCMLATDTYRREKSRESFAEAQRCQEKLLANPSGKTRFVISAGALQRTLHR